MRTLTVVCDRCKKEIIDHDQIWPVSVHLKNYTKLEGEWCRSCVIETNLLVRADEATTQPRVEPKPTIEDFIREIAREEINNI